METQGCPDFSGAGFKRVARRAAAASRAWPAPIAPQGTRAVMNARRPSEALHLDSAELGRIQSRVLRVNRQTRQKVGGVHSRLRWFHRSRISRCRPFHPQETRLPTAAREL